MRRPRLRSVRPAAAWSAWGPPLVIVAVAALVGLLGACGSGGSTTSAPVTLTAEQIAGRQVFLSATQPSCASCHTLAQAGSSSRVGASLDVMRPTAGVVAATVRAGVPPMMPAFAKVLTDAQITQVAAYVAAVAGK